MTRFFRITLIAIVTIVTITSCQNPVTMIENPDYTQPGISAYEGMIFKGPFQVGSSIAVLELDETLQQTGSSYHGDVIDDDGSYSIAAAPFAGPVELIATGNFFDEVSGSNRGEITLRALTDDDGTVNINVATAIQRDRIRALVQDGQTFAAAKETAQSELWSAFGWTTFSTDSTKIALDGIDGDRLLALSSIIAKTPAGGIRSISDMSALIVNLRIDFADGVIEQQNMDLLRDSAIRVDAQKVRDNLTGYFTAMSKTVNVPVPETALRNFIDTMPAVTVEYDENNFIKPELAGAQDGIMGMGRNDGFLIGDGEELIITVTSDTDYFNVTPNDFTEVEPGVYSASGLGYRQIGVSFGNIPSDMYGAPEVQSYTVTIDVSGADDFTIVYTVDYPY